MRPLRRLALSLAVLCWVSGAIACALPARAEPAAPPAPGKTLVVMGDSYTANGLHVFDGDGPACRRGAGSWPNELSRLMHLAGTPDFEDVSCPGASLASFTHYTLLHEVRDAADAGSFGPRTKIVAIQMGMNDAWGHTKSQGGDSLYLCALDFRDGCGRAAVTQDRISDPNAVTGDAYADRIRTVITYIKYYAPNARIALVGYPEIVAPHATSTCVSILGAGNLVQDRASALVGYLDRLDHAQRDAARDLGIDFFDARTLTAGHGICSPQPWLNGFMDPRADFFGMPLHPSVQGDNVLASALYQRLNR